MRALHTQVLLLAYDTTYLRAGGSFTRPPKTSPLMATSRPCSASGLPATPWGLRPAPSSSCCRLRMALSSSTPSSRRRHASPSHSAPYTFTHLHICISHVHVPSYISHLMSHVSPLTVSAWFLRRSNVPSSSAGNRAQLASN